MTSSNVRRVVIRLLAGLFLLGASGCGGEAGTQAPATDDVIDVGPAQLQSIQRTLRLGTSGEDVAVLHAFLTKSGYFPNDGLLRLYPAWRPIVEDAPRDPRVFDENTLRAVEAYQRNSGMPVTGEIDPGVLARFAERSCGVPDGIPRIDPSEKFAIYGSWGTHEIGWALTNTDGDLRIDVARAELTSAFAMWAGETDLTFVERGANDANTQLILTFTNTPGGFPAQTFPHPFPNPLVPNQKMIAFHPSITWTTGPSGPPMSGILNFQSVALHEIGHGLGLDHSNRVDAKMHFTAPGGLNLFPEDRIAISIVYDTWKEIQGNGLAQDIAGLPTDNVLSQTLLWAVGWDDFGGGNYGIWRWNGATWTRSDLTGYKVAAEPNGLPWAIKANGDVYCRTSHNLSTGSWRPRQLCALDMAIGADGSIWATRCDGRLVKWIKSEKCTYNIVAGDSPWQVVPFVSGRWAGIPAVSPNGTPWVIADDFRIYRRATGIVPGTAAQQAWTEVPGGGTAIDLAFDPSGYVYALGTDQVPGTFNFGIWVWNDQPCVDTSGLLCVNLPPMDNGAPPRRGWVRMSAGYGWNLTTAGTARPIVALAEGPIYRTLR